MAKGNTHSSSDLDRQLAHFAEVQAELLLMQERVTQIIAAADLSTSPAILVGKMLVSFAVVFGVGVLIGVLL